MLNFYSKYSNTNIFYVQNGTTPSEAPDKDNNQLHIVVIT